MSTATPSMVCDTMPGTTMGWLEASIELALQRPDIGGQFRQYLQTLDLS